MGVHSYTIKVCCIALLLWFVELGCGVTDPNDLKILLDFKNGLDNPELLNWPAKGDDPCGSPPWPHVFCSKDRVAQIQVQNMGIKGTLPQNFNQLSQLYNIGLQRNKFYGKLPTFKGLSMLEFAFLDYNDFDTIPSDFFEGLSSIRVLALDGNPLNKSTGWSLPPELANLSQLVNLTMSECNLVGPLPDFLGTLPSLNSLTLSSNKLFGEIPRSFGQSSMRVLWLDSQAGAGLTGPIDVIAHMTSLTQLWLQGNSFTGKIPDKIGDLSLLRDIDLNTNQLVGFVPKSLADMQLENLDLSNNRLMGPVPAFKAKTVSYKSNPFCQTKAGEKCAPEVNALLDFLGGMDYPFFLASQWSGNDPCQGPWLGVSCDMRSQKVSVINLPRRNLTGILSPSIGKLDSLVQVRLGGNKISGTIPSNLTDLISLKVLDVSGNNLGPPLPTFRDTVKLVIDRNPLLAPTTNQSHQPPSPAKSPPIVGQQPPQVIPPSTGEQPSPPTDLDAPPSPTKGSVPSSSGSNQVPTQPKSSSQNRFIIIATVIAGLVVLVVLTFCMYCFCMKRKVTSEVGGSFVVHPRNSSDPENAVKIAVSSNTTGSLSSKTGFTSVSSTSGLTDNSHTIESGSLVISVQVLRKVTSNFSQNNELGRGGFGTVYKGELEDGTKLAVKRMEAGIVSNKAVLEFEAEISVLSKVRHRHLVSLLGYSIEGNERLLVYEYMPQGALSRHLFHWKNFNLKPLSWTKRLSIALDVARAMEYLHNLGRQTFIHRDLKSSNILLGEDFHAKVSDFGLVKLAPDGEKSVVTRLAGTFGYLAPEYAVMGKVTTKTDVFSFGVVLMELVTGLMALDEKRSEESRYLAEWFWRIKSSKEKLMAAIDPALDADDEGVFDSISIIAELAGHCTAREPSHRPDMRHAVNVLSPLVEIWKPISPESDDFSGIDYSLPLPQMLKVWQDAESTGVSCDSSLEDSKGSIPARPAGFAESFTSADGR